MKKVGKVILVVIVALVLLGSLSSACSRSSSSSASSDAEQTASSNAVEPAKSEVSEHEDASKAFLGTWDMIKYEYDGTNFGKEELQAARDQGSDSYLVINGDGTALIVTGDSAADFTWEAKSATSIKLKTGYRYLTGNLEGDELVFNVNDGVMAFERRESRSSLPAVSSEGEGSSASSDSTQAAPEENGEVSPDLKVMLDSYEEFMDEYVEFMTSYQESGDTMSMLSQYTEYMQKYTDLMQKIEAVDTSNMSAADYAYYIEVTSRVSEKLLKVSVI